ncbi:hypothetical protein Q5O14_01895 [Eubacteriaceae bacterium ES2]|nr:hypothetical protein Q5O14_01895 [Eubacteriaceae bacterium ES2]
MANKDFEKGIEAGARPFENKFRQMTDSLDGISKNLDHKFDRVNDTFDVIIDDLNSIEKKRLYDLNTVVDILELDEDERELLVSILYTLANMIEPTDLQQYFIRSVKRHLKIKNPQTEVNLASIENVESINSQKAMLQTIMEYFFLSFGNHDYVEKYDELFSYFSVNRRGQNEIIEKINAICEATGLEGVAENYGFVPENKVTGYIDNDVIEIIELTELDAINLENNLVIKSNETKEFRNNIVNVNTNIICEGSLTFENCLIIYNDQGVPENVGIDLSGLLTFTNCKIECKSVRKTNESDVIYFIKAKSHSKMLIKNCDIICASYFYQMQKKFFEKDYQEVNGAEIAIDSCKLFNISSGFVNDEGENNKKTITRCLFEFSEIPSQNFEMVGFNHEDEYEYFHGTPIVSGNDLSISDCKIIGTDTFLKSKHKIDIFDVRGEVKHGSIENCTFVNIDNCIYSMNIVKNCQFSHCAKVIRGLGSGAKYNFTSKFFGGTTDIETFGSATVIESTFVDCQDVISTAESESKIINSQFLECQNTVIDKYSPGQKITVEFCEFYNIKNTDRFGTIRLDYLGDESVRSQIKNCSFKGVDAGDSYIIDAMAEKVVALVEECSFENCKSNRGQVIQEVSISYSGGIFKNKKKIIDVIDVRNCKGVDSVSQSGVYNGEINIKKTTSTGEIIGVKSNLEIGIGSGLV